MLVSNVNPTRLPSPPAPLLPPSMLSVSCAEVKVERVAADEADEVEKSYTLRESTREEVRVWEVWRIRRDERVERVWALVRRASMFCWI